MRIAILDDFQRIALRLADWSPVQARADVVVFDRHLSEAEAAVELRDFDAICLLRERTAVPRSLIGKLPQLKFIAITGRVHRTLDMAAAAERGIVVSYADGPAGPGGTTELAWGLILTLARHLDKEIPAMRQGGWQTTYGTMLRGRTLGVLGLGRLGRHMPPVAKAFGMNVIAWSQNMTPESAQEAGAAYVQKDQLFAQSDYVSLHLVLSERTRHIVGSREIALMKPDACLVNTARGGLVDHDALVDALRARRIRGAAIDVFDQEPLPDSEPLRKLDNVILTPHLGYTVEETLRGFYQGTVENVLAFLDGAPMRLAQAPVTPKA